MKLKPTLLILYLVVWSLLAIDPWYRSDWLLENILVFIALPIILWSEKKYGFSTASTWMLFTFFILHAIGAHYTYSEMPFFTLVTEFFGFERNHYDRLVHFMFTFLLFLPFYEFFTSFQKLKYNALLITVLFLVALSGVYEVLEWGATEMTHPELGTAFLGMQGDSWDAQKDMTASYMGILFFILFWKRLK
jgi:putative membrane protein